MSQYRPSPVPPGIEPLVLLSERNSRSGITQEHKQQAQASSTALPDVPAAEASAGQDSAVTASAAAGGAAPKSVPESMIVETGKERPACQAIGPLRAENDANSISEQLTARGFRARIRVEEEHNPSGYWVFMPAMPAADARRVVAELDARGLTDHYIGNQGSISLGIFSRKEMAQQHLDRVRALGFDALLDQRYRTRNLYWIDVTEDNRPLRASTVWAKIQQQFPDIQSRPASCE